MANKSNLDANHGGEVKAAVVGYQSQRGREEIVGSGKSSAVKAEPRKNNIGVSEGQNS